jgi:hypothetical protein
VRALVNTIRNLRVAQMLGNSCVVKRLAASQGKLSSMELV